MIVENPLYKNEDKREDLINRKSKKWIELVIYLYVTVKVKTKSMYTLTSQCIQCKSFRQSISKLSYEYFH